MSAFGKVFRKGAKTASEIASNAKYLDSITGAARKTDEFIANSAEFAGQTSTLKRFVSNKPEAFANVADGLDEVQLTSLKGVIGNDDWAKLVEINPKLAKKLLGGAGDDVLDAAGDAAKKADAAGDAAGDAADAAGDAADAAGDAAKKADDLDLDNIDDLNKLDSLGGPQRKLANEALSKKYADMSVEARKIEADKFLDAGEEGMKAFKKLPSDVQGDLISANKKLRWKAGQTPVGFDWVKGACKNYPKMCVIGAAGGLVGAGFAGKEIYDKVEEAFDDKEEEKRACIATCLPEDFYDSKVSTYGTKEYKDLTFRTIEDVKASSGDDNITAQNTPLCTASMDPPEKCQQMCVERCDKIHKSFLEKLVSRAGGLARDVADEAAGVAGKGIKGFLDGFFGEGMGIPSAIGIFIFIIIIMVLVSTM